MTYDKARPGPRFHKALRGQKLIGAVYRTEADAQQVGRRALAGQALVFPQPAGSDLPGDVIVKLQIERRFAVGVQRDRDEFHKAILLLRQTDLIKKS